MMASIPEGSAETADDVNTPDSGVGDGVFVSPEEKARQHEEWKHELNKTEEEILTLRQVLNAKERHANELKRKLGITMWKEFTEDMNKGLVSVRESQAYQKSTSAVRTMAEKTTTTLGGLGSVITSKLGDMRDNAAFKSFEERVTATVDAVKVIPLSYGKVGGSRSTSVNEFDDALKEAEAKHSDEVAKPDGK